MPTRRFSSPNAAVSVEISHDAFESMVATCQRSLDIETGSILIGRYSGDGAVAQIQEALAPSADSAGTSSIFMRGIKGLSRELISRWTKTASYYLGEWHYHPLGSGQPSDRDINQMFDFARTESMQSPVPVMIIVFRSKHNEYKLRVFVFTQDDIMVELSNVIEIGEEEQMTNKIDLRGLFLNLQGQMIARLKTDSGAIGHPTTKGDASEENWRAMLSEYLPKRYQVEKGFLVDSDGSISDQIDIVIFDRQYSPFLFNQDGCKYMPAESAYAVFEVRPELNAQNVAYAGDKIASVRKLNRTSVAITYAGGKYEPRTPIPIIGGILTLDSTWNPVIGESLNRALSVLSADAQLEIGCVLKHASFQANYKKGKLFSIEESKNDTCLMFFFIRLLSLLQNVGTVPAIDLSQYGRDL